MVSHFCITAKDTKTAGSESEATGKSYAPLPKGLSVDELHGHANVVVSRVLSRPQSGMSFDADVKEAKLMWADRLFRIIGSSSKGNNIIFYIMSTRQYLCMYLLRKYYKKIIHRLVDGGKVNGWMTHGKRWMD